MDENEMIKRLADRIRDRIRGGMVYGVPIDMNNPDHLILAAYSHGTQEQRNYDARTQLELQELMAMRP